MDPRTLQVFQRYCTAVVRNTIKGGAALYVDLPKASDGWPVDDKVYDRFLDLVVDQSAFLGRIGWVRGLSGLTGNKLSHDITGNILKRTNVSDTVQRQPTITGGTSADPYTLLRAEWDWTLDYDKLAHWAKRGEAFLSTAVNTMIAKKLASSMLLVGFVGTSDGNPPVAAGLTDFQVGWLQLLREYAAGANFMAEVVASSGIITVGPKRVLVFEGAAVDKGGGKVGFPITAHGRPAGAQIVINGTTNYDGAYLVDATSTANEIVVTVAYVLENVTGKTATHTPDYTSLDALAADLRNSIEVELRMGLSCIVSDDLRATEEEVVYGESGRTPTERLAHQRLMVEIAGMERLSPSLMPNGTLVVTPPDNLQIYVSEQQRRKVEDDPERNGVTFWNTGWWDYVIGDARKMKAAENIVITL